VEGKAEIYTTEDGKRRGATERLSLKPERALFAGDGSKVALAGTGRICVADVASGKVLQHWDAPESSLIAAPGSLASLWSAKKRGSAIRKWDPATGALQRTIELPPGTAVESMVVTPDGMRLLTALTDGTTLVWDASR
jgi:WD40 repeat protein